MALRFYNTFKAVYASGTLTTFSFLSFNGSSPKLFLMKLYIAKNASQSSIQQALWKENMEKRNVICSTVKKSTSDHFDNF